VVFEHLIDVFTTLLETHSRYLTRLVQDRLTSSTTETGWTQIAST